MPYGKRAPRRNYRKTSYAKPKQTTLQKIGNVAIKGFKIASKIASIINSEKKFYDDYYVPTAVVVGTPMIRHITAIPQGSGDGQRNGLSIAIDSIQGKHRIVWGGMEGEMRHIIFIAKKNMAGVLPSASDILQDASTAVTQMVSPRSKLNRFDYEILLDEHYTQDTSKAIIYKKYFHQFPMKKDSQGNRTVKHHAQYTGTTYSNTSDGNIYEIWMSSGTADPSIGGFNRVRYYDN